MRKIGSSDKSIELNEGKILVWDVAASLMSWTLKTALYKTYGAVFA